MSINFGVEGGQNMRINLDENAFGTLGVGRHTDAVVHLDIAKQAVVVATNEIKRLRSDAARLREAAQAVVDRWDTPLWKMTIHTGDYIDRLRVAIDAARTQGDKP